MEIKRQYPFIDMLFPALAIIDFQSGEKQNTLYVLNTKEYTYILVYKQTLPVFSDIYEIEEESIEDEEIEDITDMSIVDDFEESLDDDIAQYSKR